MPRAGAPHPLRMVVGVCAYVCERESVCMLRECMCAIDGYIERVCVRESACVRACERGVL